MRSLIGIVDQRQEKEADGTLDRPQRQVGHQNPDLVQSFDRHKLLIAQELQMPAKSSFNGLVFNNIASQVECLQTSITNQHVHICA